MVRTRKRSYGEELSQSSSNIAYSDNPIRPEGKRQQKRHKNSEERSFCSFNMSNVNSEFMEFLQLHDTTYLELLGNVCSGEDRTLGSMGTKGSKKNRTFWLNFAITLCRNTRSDYQDGLEVTCQQYCERLRKTHKLLTGPNFHSVETPFLNQLNRIFGVGRPSTSEGSLRSRGSISSGTSQSGKRQKELYTALAKLTHAKVFPLEEIERVEEFVSKSKLRLHAFLEGDMEYQGNTVKAFLEKDSHKKPKFNSALLETEIQETEVQETEIQPY